MNLCFSSLAEELREAAKRVISDALCYGAGYIMSLFDKKENKNG